MALIQVQGFGEAITGLDWIALPGLESPGVEIRQLARSANAQWQYTWKKAGKPTPYICFVPRGKSKKKPVAAGMLVSAAIHDQTYMTLIEIDDLQYWVFAAVDGQPAKRMDFVGKAPAVLNSIRDFISTLSGSEELPVYTNLPELLDTLPHRFDVRPFSLDILAHSIQKKDYSQAKFQRYSPLSLKVTLFVSFALLASAGYSIFQDQIEQMQLRQAAKERQIEIDNKLKELSASVEKEINSSQPIAHVMPALWHALSSLPIQINGWKLTSIFCEALACTLTYQAQSFSTWRGYMLAKPSEWADPSFTADTAIVNQSIAVELVESHKRNAEQLQSKDSLRYELGNLAQLVAPLGMQLRFLSNWEKVIEQGQPQKNGLERLNIPLRSEFTVTGPSILLTDFSQRLPVDASFQSLSIKLEDKSTFELKGQMYARP